MMPRSILKSRRSEESLSPLSDDCVPVISGSGGNAALTGSCDDFRSDEKSADFRFDNQKNSSNNSSSNIRPSILKQRDSSRDEGYHSSKLRDKSRSPSRGATCSPPENVNEVVFSGKIYFYFYVLTFNKDSLKKTLIQNSFWPIFGLGQNFLDCPKSSKLKKKGSNLLTHANFLSKSLLGLGLQID